MGGFSLFEVQTLVFRAQKCLVFPIPRRPSPSRSVSIRWVKSDALSRKRFAISHSTGKSRSVRIM